MGEHDAAEYISRKERSEGLYEWVKENTDNQPEPEGAAWLWLNDFEITARSDKDLADDINDHMRRKIHHNYRNHNRYHMCKLIKDDGMQSSTEQHLAKLLRIVEKVDSKCLAAFAVADFIIDPREMTCTFLSLAGRLLALSEATDQKYDVLDKAKGLYENAWLAAASCLETLYHQSKSMTGRYHYELSSMVLRSANFGILNGNMVYGLPSLGPIKTAIDNKASEFFTQPVVQMYLRREWVGGQANLHWLSVRSMLSSGVLLVLMLPINLVLFLWTSVCVERLGRIEHVFQSDFFSASGVTKERFGIFLVPAVKFFTNTASNLCFAVLFTFWRMNPHCVSVGSALKFGDSDYQCATGDDESRFSSQWSFAILLCWSISFIFMEARQFFGVYLAREWVEHQEAIAFQINTRKRMLEQREGRFRRQASRFLAVTNREPSPLELQKHSTTLGVITNMHPALPKHQSMADVENSTRSSPFQRMGVRVQERENWLLMQIACVCEVCYMATVDYVKSNWLDFAACATTFASIVFAADYPNHATTSVRFHSMAVFFQWWRLDRAFIPFTGNRGLARFYIMTRKMFFDVFAWTVIYAVFLFAFTSAQFVLYRNKEAGFGPPFGSVQDQCTSLQSTLTTWADTMLLQIDAILTGEAYLQCFFQSNDVFGFYLQAVYIIISVVLLLNMLIAMMGETFSVMAEAAHNETALQFANEVLEMASLPSLTPPINLLQIPVQLMKMVLSLLQGSLTCLGCSKSSSCAMRTLDYAMAFIAPPSQEVCPGLRAYVSGCYMHGSVRIRESELQRFKDMANKIQTAWRKRRKKILTAWKNAARNRYGRWTDKARRLIGYVSSRRSKETGTLADYEVDLYEVDWKDVNQCDPEGTHWVRKTPPKNQDPDKELFCTESDDGLRDADELKLALTQQTVFTKEQWRHFISSFYPHPYPYPHPEPHLGPQPQALSQHRPRPYPHPHPHPHAHPYPEKSSTGACGRRAARAG